MKKPVIIILLIACVITAVILWVEESAKPIVVNPPPNTSGGNNELLSQTYSDPTYKFSIKYPSSYVIANKFEGTYLLPGYWKVDAMDETKGVPVVAIREPRSNEVLLGEVRVGASTDVGEVANCLKAPSQTTISTESINGKTFSVFSTSEGAMMHFSRVKSYRTVNNNTCFAIDEVIYGTNPEVYDPPRTVPFDENTTKNVMDQVVSTFIFNS